MNVAFLVPRVPAARFCVRISYGAYRSFPVLKPAFSMRHAQEQLTAYIHEANARGWYALRCGPYQFVLLRRNEKQYVSIDAPSFCPN